MNKNNFVTLAHAKCILVGEHAVIQGYPALVAPIRTKFIALSYQPADVTLTLDCDSLHIEQLMLIFWQTFRHGLHLLKKDISSFKGKFFLKNNIPIGAGIGFSSALCVVITQCFIWQGWLAENKLLVFAKKLEGLFHGTSSGVDIAGAMAKQCVFFTTKSEPHEINLNWQPKLYLSFSESHKSTAESVNKVNYLKKTHPALARFLYEEMSKSTLMVEKSFSLDQTQGLALLIHGINKAYQCFQQWGLINNEMKTHINNLLQLGALAVKPTGAGGGGYILSVWKDKPDKTLPFKLIPIF